ncbi:MAG: sigma-70 family RNA polymerase sigma factor [Planctomycetales bacterium]
MNDEAAVIAKVKQGEADAFRELVDRHGDRLFCFIRNLVADAHQAEDLAQETFLAAYRNIGVFYTRQGKFSTWLLTIARNKCFTALKRRRTVSLSAESDPADARTPEKELVQDEFFARLDSVLAELPFVQKTAFILAEIQDLSYEEISRVEQVKIGTVKSRVARAREKLRKEFRCVAGDNP